MGRLGIILCAVFLAGCPPPKVQSYRIYEDPTAFVRLELDPTADPDHSESWNDHPAAVSIEKMTAVLQCLLVLER